jgi:hypothetical protein
VGTSTSTSVLFPPLPPAFFGDFLGDFVLLVSFVGENEVVGEFEIEGELEGNCELEGESELEGAFVILSTSPTAASDGFEPLPLSAFGPFDEFISVFGVVTAAAFVQST